MRALLPALLLAACASTVRDLPAGRAAPEGLALVAGRLDFAGSVIQPSLWLESPDGKPLVVRPESDAFLVPLEPGTYAVTQFGGQALLNDRLTFEARAGEARYIGTFTPGRSEEGDLLVLVRDERAGTEETLRARYGAGMPALVSHLVSSSLVPVPPGAPLALKLAEVRPPFTGPGWYYDGWYYPYWRGSYYGRWYRPRPPPPRGPR